MRTLLSIAAGGPETLALTDVAPPVLDAGKARVEVKACAVNFPDVLIIEDKYQVRPPRPFAPGVEISGVVTEVYRGVSTVAPGDRVMGVSLWGGMAEQVAIDATKLVRIPDEMPFDEAGAFPVAYGTAYHALKQRGRLQGGDRLLVLGAAGGVGLAAIQVAKTMGAHVVAAASNDEKVRFCCDHGADAGVVYARAPLEDNARKALSDSFKKASGGNGFDVIFDAVGGDYTEAAIRALAWGGRYAIIGFAAGDIPRIATNLLLLKSCDMVGVWWGSWIERNPDAHQQNNDALMALYRGGKLRPHISARLPLERGGEALELLAKRKVMGKVVVMIG